MVWTSEDDTQNSRKSILTTSKQSKCAGEVCWWMGSHISNLCTGHDFTGPILPNAWGLWSVGWKGILWIRRAISLEAGKQGKEWGTNPNFYPVSRLRFANNVPVPVVLWVQLQIPQPAGQPNLYKQIRKLPCFLLEGSHRGRNQTEIPVNLALTCRSTLVPKSILLESIWDWNLDHDNSLVDKSKPFLEIAFLPLDYSPQRQLPYSSRRLRKRRLHKPEAPEVELWIWVTQEEPEWADKDVEEVEGGAVVARKALERLLR